MEDIKIQVHSLPAVVMLEAQLPEEIIDSLNNYLDKLYKDKKRKSLAGTLVGQIHRGQQLLMDHKDPVLEEYYKFITNMAVNYLDVYNNIVGTKHTGKIIDIDELWSVHSYEGDYNPIHDHGTKTLMGISTTAWTKVPKQIGKKGENPLESYDLYNSSGACDGFLAFNYGRNSLMDAERLRPSQSVVMQPKVGRQLMFPSWLQHMVYPFFGKGERRTVAANLNCFNKEEQ